MRNQIDDYEKKIMEKLDQEAEEIERRIEENPQVTEFEASEGLDRKVYAGVEAYENAIARKTSAGTDTGRAENTDISDLTGLTEGDREALRLGRELQRRRREKERRKETRKFAGGWKRAVAVVVALVLIVGFGVDSIGGPNRVVEIMKQAVGGREISKITSSTEKTKHIEIDEEAQTYQQIKDVLGIDPVRIRMIDKEMKYKYNEIDSDIRIAQIMYEYEEKNISYLIDASYTKETWGIDIEDAVLDEYPYVEGKLNAKVTEYQLPENNGKKYSAEFEYKGIYYQLVGTMEWKIFEKILNNLQFPG